MSFPEARRTLLKTITLAPALGFVPVAVHFQLFDCLATIGGPGSAQHVFEEHKKRAGDETNLSVQLTDDTLFMMAALGLLENPSDNLYQANDVTRFMVELPSSQHGAMHFTSEILMGSAFLMKQLVDTDFKYPFEECQAPFQYAHRSMNSDFAHEHAYKIMEHSGRLDSFNTFMTGKFGRGETMPDRVQKLGYDLAGLLSASRQSGLSTTIVDIGGGRGELLLEIKNAFPFLEKRDLVLQEFNSELGDLPGVTEMPWNFKEEGREQPIKGALIYSLAFVLHNLSDHEAVKLLRKLAAVMSPHSRLIIQELSKNMVSATTHGAMIAMYGGRERTSAEWNNLAAEAGLMVTFEKYPPVGECLVEMRQVLN